MQDPCVSLKRLALTAAVLAGLAGCVGYSSYPGVDSLAPSSTNFIQVKPAVTAALREVTERYHPEWAGAFVINLPAGMTPEAQEQILADLGPDARAMTPETVHFPTYHVGRIWVRGPEAKIDIVRPVLELGPRPDGGIVYQGMTVWLNGGLNPWAVDFVQPWSVGVVTPPDANFVRRPSGGGDPAPEPGAEIEQQPESPEQPVPEPAEPEQPESDQPEQRPEG